MTCDNPCDLAGEWRASGELFRAGKAQPAKEGEWIQWYAMAFDELRVCSRPREAMASSWHRSWGSAASRTRRLDRRLRHCDSGRASHCHSRDVYFSRKRGGAAYPGVPGHYQTQDCHREARLSGLGRRGYCRPRRKRRTVGRSWMTAFLR